MEEEIGWRVWIVIKLKFLIKLEIIGEEDNNKKNLYLLARLILDFFFVYVEINTKKKKKILTWSSIFLRDKNELES